MSSVEGGFAAGATTDGPVDSVPEEGENVDYWKARALDAENKATDAKTARNYVYEISERLAAKVDQEVHHRTSAFPNERRLAEAVDQFRRARHSGSIREVENDA